LAQSLVVHLLVGCILGALAAGFSLIWGVTRVVNVAHAAIALLAAYLVYELQAAWNLSPLLALGGLVPLFFGLGMLTEYLLIRPIARRADDLEFTSLVVLFGVSIGLEHSLAAIWTPNARVLKTTVTGQAMTLGPVHIPLVYLVGAALALVTLVILDTVLTRTRTGTAVRAVWQNRPGAALCGVPLRRVTMFAYGLAFASAGVAGVALALIQPFTPATHLSWLVQVFLVAIVGGVGSVRGAGAAGLLVGVALGIGAVLLPFAWVNLLLFACLIVVLWWRPGGLLQR
jgi:branched-chain amino acid transport system permease protein